MKRASGLFQGKSCKGICSHFEKSRPYRNPYETHVLCTRCKGTLVCRDGVWFEKERLTDKGRCPCCNFRPRHKAKTKQWHNKKLIKHDVSSNTIGQKC